MSESAGQPSESNEYLYPADTWPGLFERISDLLSARKEPGFVFPRHERAPTRCRWEIGNVPDHAWMLDKSTNGFSAGYLRAEDPFRLEIETAIRALCAGQRPAISAEVRYFINVRVTVVEELLFWLTIGRRRTDPNETETIVPFPNRSVAATVEWLMIDWFNEHGADIAALLRLKQRHTGLEKSGDAVGE